MGFSLAASCGVLGVVAKLITRKASVRLDTKQLMAEHPEIDYESYKKVGKPTLSLTIKETK